MRIGKRAVMLLLASVASVSCGATFSEPKKTATIEAEGKELEEIADRYHALGNSFIASSPDSAIMFYQKALEKNPNHLLSLYHLGEAHLISHNYSKAEETHKRAIGINPKNPESWRHLALTYDNSGRYQEAANCWREIIRLCESKDHEIRLILQKSLGMTPDNYAICTYLFLAQSSMRAGQLNDALEAANQVLRKRDPNFIPLLYIRAQILEKMGEYRKAIEDYEMLIT